MPYSLYLFKQKKSLYRTHFYLGSTNLNDPELDRSKELGVMASDCQLLGSDASSVFDQFWTLAATNQTSGLKATFNQSRPAVVQDNLVYLTMSPKPIRLKHQTDELEVVLHSIKWVFSSF